MQTDTRRAPIVAVLIPCRNEGRSIGTVVTSFRAELPTSTIFVYDNNSTDDTVARARSAGANVRHETKQGKGNVVRRMFADIDADIYVLVDGDDTYDASSVTLMIALMIDSQLDMVNATRITDSAAAFRRGHRFGNALLSGMVARIFGRDIKDMLSGYRVFSRRFVKSFPATASGFETETEFTVHALELRMPVGEIELQYRERPSGSESKLRTYIDGIRILKSIVFLVKEGRPLLFFSLAALLLSLIALGLAVPLIVTYLQTGLVPRLPTAVLVTGLVLLAFLSLVCGLILDTVSRGRREMKILAYLSIPGIAASVLALEALPDAR